MGLRFPSFSWHVNVWSLLLVCLAGCECFVTLTGCWGKSLKAQWYHSSFVHDSKWGSRHDQEMGQNNDLLKIADIHLN